MTLDYESRDVLLAVDYVVTVTDAGSPVALSSSTKLRLVVADINDNSPVFGVGQFEFQVPENQSPGFHVGAVTAVDADDPPYNRVVYRLTTDALGMFTIDRNSGVIVTAAELDREQVKLQNSYTLTYETLATGGQPAYLLNLLNTYQPVCSLRSQVNHLLAKPSVYTSVGCHLSVMLLHKSGTPYL